MCIFSYCFYTVCSCVDNAPVICNHCPPPPPPPPPPTGNSGDNDFSSIRALLKTLHCGDLLRVIALLFIRVNFTGVYLRNITSPAFTRYCGGTQKVMPRTLAPLSPAHPRRWWWGGAGVTNDWCIRCEALRNILRFFSTSLINSVIPARIQSSIYHMAIKAFFIGDFRTKTSRHRH